MTEDIPQLIRHEIENAQEILVISHLRADGDAVGSVLGLGVALWDAGKQVQMVLPDGAPKTFRHLPYAKQIKKKPAKPFDFVIVVDCSDLSRTGDILDQYGTPDINIDHHITNLNFGRVNFVDPASVSASQILARHMEDFGLKITKESATGLLTGLVTDTLGFRTSNMTPEALHIAADLMEYGVDLSELYTKFLVEKSYSAIKYWGQGISHLQREGPMVWTTLSFQDREAADYIGRDDADLINVLSSIKEGGIAMVFIEQDNGFVKISWRARKKYDVSGIALQFGGGGHPAASGAEVQGELEEVVSNVLAATRKLV